MTGDRRGKRLTSVDVAREAGVSRATVSYVLNDTPNQRIPEATRRRVWAAVERLGYAPSAAARSLRSGRSDVVLTLLPDWPIGRMVGTLLEEIALALSEVGLIFVAHPRAGSERPIADIWKAISPAAVVTWESLDAGDELAMRAAGIELAVVLFEAHDQNTGGLSVSEQRTGRLQAEHLASRGHRRIGYAYPADERVHAFAEPRLAGVRSACAELGLAEPDVRTVGIDRASAADALRDWAAGGDPVTAVCAYNDEVAYALLSALRAAGRSAPDDLAVIGVDDLPISAVFDPPLTTVVTDPRVLARYISSAVLAGLAGEPPPRYPGSDILRLVVRDST